MGTVMDRVTYGEMVIQDLVNAEQSSELNIRPWYQRRSVWTVPQQAYLINTLFEQKPVPSLYVRHSLDIDKGKSIKEVVDGQQRTRAILDFVKGSFRARHPVHKRPILFSELSPVQKSAFLMTSLSIGYLIGADDSDVIDIFGRLNSVSKNVNPQERRNAIFSGEFKQFALREASMRVQFWRDYSIFSANNIARMDEVQFVSELAINMINGLSDYSAKSIDTFYKKNDESFKEADELAGRMEKVFSKIVSLDISAIQETIFRRTTLFFSLFIILDSIGAKISHAKLAKSLFEIDESYNSDTPVSARTQTDANFYFACTASVQRIKSRKIRDEYIRRALNKG